MRPIGAVLTLCLVIICSGCGDDSDDRAGEPQRTSGATRTSTDRDVQDLPTGTTQTVIGGSGGYIETPKSVSTTGVPPTFKGEARRIYAGARAGCSAPLQKRFVREQGSARKLAELYANAVHRRWRRAAIEGCLAGLRSR